MITEKEFQEALKIVNLYIEQLNNDIIIKQNIVANFSKTNILDWIKEKKKTLPKVTSNHTRLFNILIGIYNVWNVEFIEDVLNLHKFRNSSKKTESLFYELISMDSKEADPQ